MLPDRIVTALVHLATVQHLPFAALVTLLENKEYVHADQFQPLFAASWQQHARGTAEHLSASLQEDEARAWMQQKIDEIFPRPDPAGGGRPS